MPITRTEFEKGRRVPPFEKAIYQFLQKNPDKAFNVMEISDGIGVTTGQNFWEDVGKYLEVQNAVLRLAQEKKILKKMVDWEEYYTIPVARAVS